jgi:ADP-dependent phosphofructokinase/glucokinase
MSHLILLRLTENINALEYTIKNATISIIQKFGAEHPATLRLEEYHKGIQLQKDYLGRLAIAVKNHDSVAVDRNISIINGIAQMIKSDAKFLVDTMYPKNTSCDIDPNLLN